MNFQKTTAAAFVFSVLLTAAPIAFTQADEIEEAPEDVDISDICALSDCSPAKPCVEQGEHCYTVNGAFYCCSEPPSGGAMKVGE